MSWFSKSAAVVASEPEVDHFAEAQSRVRELKTSLDGLDHEMLHFKTTNHVTTDRFGRLLGVRCAELTGRAAVEREWRELLTRRDALVSAWHRALHVWSELKLTNRGA